MAECCEPAHLQVCMTVPPPIMPPTQPQPVAPLQLPCISFLQKEKVTPNDYLTPDQIERFRYNNYYNNYNEDWRDNRVELVAPRKRCCEPFKRKPQTEGDEGCPTGFKPCEMRLRPGPGGTVCATIMPCPPKPSKRYSNRYEPECCTRPGCKHWKSKQPPCQYDDVCRAHCYDHPIGIKPWKNV